MTAGHVDEEGEVETTMAPKRRHCRICGQDAHHISRVRRDFNASYQATESTIAFSVALGRIALAVSSTFGR